MDSFILPMHPHSRRVYFAYLSIAAAPFSRCVIHFILRVGLSEIPSSGISPPDFD